MIKKIVAASLAILLISTTASSQIAPVENQGIIVAQDSDPISIDELTQRAVVCIAYISNQIPAEQIISVYKLDTDRKKRDWEIQCQLMALGIDIGYKKAQEDIKNTI